MSTTAPKYDKTLFHAIELLLHLRRSGHTEPTITAVDLVMQVTQLPRKSAHGLLCNLRSGCHAARARRILRDKSPIWKTYVLTRAACLELLELLPHATTTQATGSLLDKLFVEARA
jgi:hypothetical protein